MRGMYSGDPSPLYADDVEMFGRVLDRVLWKEEDSEGFVLCSKWRTGLGRSQLCVAMVIIFSVHNATVMDYNPPCLMLPNLPPTSTHQITSRSRTQSMNGSPLLPYTTLPLDHTDDLFRHPGREAISAAASAFPLGGRIENPSEGRSTSLSQTEWHRNLEGYTATCCSSLAADAEQWCY